MANYDEDNPNVFGYTPNVRSQLTPAPRPYQPSAPRVIGNSGVAGFPEPSDNPEAGPITNIRYRGPSDSPTGIFSSPFEIGPAQGMNDRGAGPLARAANAVPSVAPIGAANAAPSQPITPAVAPITAAPEERTGERAPGTSVRLEGATPAMLQAIAADMQGGRNYSPITGPQRTRAGPSRAAYLQARQSGEGEPPPAAPPTGSASGARIEQYFTPPEGPVGGPLNRGGVQIQNADGTITTQEPNAVTPQIRPAAGGAPVEIVRGSQGSEIQRFGDGGSRIWKAPGETVEQAQQRADARAAVSQAIQTKMAQGLPLSRDDLISYHLAHGLNADHLFAAQAAVEGAGLHSAATLGAAQAHAEAARYAADQTIRSGETREMDVPVGGTELGSGLGKPNVVRGVFNVRTGKLRSALGEYDMNTGVFTPAPAGMTPSHTWEGLKALKPVLSPSEFQRHLSGLPADELTKAKKELPAMAAGLAFETGKKYTDKNGTSAVYGGKDAKGNDIWNANTPAAAPAAPPPQAVEYLKKNPASRAFFEKTYGVSADQYLQGFAVGGLIGDEGPLESAADAAPLPQTRKQVIADMRRARGQQ